jgi:hypothetical protein
MPSTSNRLTLPAHGQSLLGIAHHRVFLPNAGEAAVLVPVIQLLPLAAAVAVGATTNAGLVFLKWGLLRQSPLVLVELPVQALIRLVIRAATQVLAALLPLMAALVAF